MDKNNVSLKNVRKLDERIFPELLKSKCSLICINVKTGQKKRMSINALFHNDREFWLKDSPNWTYFVNSSLLSSIVEKIKGVDIELEKRLSIEAQYNRNREALIEDKLISEYDNLIKKNPEERINALSEALCRINRVVNSRDASAKEKNDMLVEVSSYSFLINKVTIDEVVKLEDGEARKATFEVARMTEKIISSLTSVLNNDVKEDSFFNSLMEKSNGVTIRHMVRTFVLSYRFLLYFNHELVNNGLASKIRSRFEKKYQNWYGSLIPHIPHSELSLENVFKGGMRVVEDKDIKAYSAGFLLHDIGKQRYIDYYEGSDDYDSRKVESHAKTGYRMLLQKTVYSEKIAAIAGYHHEYYGHESGVDARFNIA